MNKELQDRLLEYLGSLDGAVRQAGGFVAEQAPLVAQEWIEFEFWSSAIQCAVLLVTGLVLLSSGVLFVRKQCRDMNQPWAIGALFCFILSCPAMAIGTGCGVRAMKASIAPRVVVLEKIADMYQRAER